MARRSRGRDVSCSLLSDRVAYYLDDSCRCGGGMPMIANLQVQDVVMYRMDLFNQQIPVHALASLPIAGALPPFHHLTKPIESADHATN
jgi:hypothetical protein